jgi:hypothetical protein
MNNDFATSILDSPYNRVEDGQKIDLFNVLEKYSYQRQNIQLSNLESEEQFYELQRLAYGKTIMELWWL